ncbi:MAG: type III pantothenate kinase [Verrucomicrobia bacterium]|nr:type III pantothenate kinase [Verrucomicrobiota bacterium]
MDLVLDIGNFRVKGAFFEGDRLVSKFRIPYEMEQLKGILSSVKCDATLISSVNRSGEEKVKGVFNELGLPFNLLDFSKVNVVLDVDEPEQVGHDRIANVYGALFHFPQNDCVVVDIGTAVTFDYAACNGHYLGGAIYPGVDISAKALAQYTSLLPEVKIAKPASSIAKTTETHIQGGLYWGLLGAVERITFEMRSLSPSPSDVKVIATGGFLERIEEFAQDLSDIVDLIDPALTLIGLHEIMKEKK